MEPESKGKMTEMSAGRGRVSSRAAKQPGERPKRCWDVGIPLPWRDCISLWEGCDVKVGQGRTNERWSSRVGYCRNHLDLDGRARAPINT